MDCTKRVSIIVCLTICILVLIITASCGNTGSGPTQVQPLSAEIVPIATTTFQPHGETSSAIAFIDCMMVPAESRFAVIGFGGGEIPAGFDAGQKYQVSDFVPHPAVMVNWVSDACQHLVPAEPYSTRPNCIKQALITIQRQYGLVEPPDADDPTDWTWDVEYGLSVAGKTAMDLCHAETLIVKGG